MSIVKLNNRSVKDVSTFGSISSLGSLVHIATQTASSSSSISFTSGIDSTYKEYIFYFVNIHAATDNSEFSYAFSSDGGSSYTSVQKQTTYFRSYHYEDGVSGASLDYRSNQDTALGTGKRPLSEGQGNANDESLSGFFHLFNTSDTTFVKHFIAQTNFSGRLDYTMNCFSAGYANSTSAINAVQFSMDTGNIDSGQILLFGVN
tara:strand:- start:219 stop:830 length:612 start_codon:yes stop_codon:yes gene_type:complete